MFWTHIGLLASLYIFHCFFSDFFVISDTSNVLDDTHFQHHFQRIALHRLFFNLSETISFKTDETKRNSRLYEIFLVKTDNEHGAFHVLV